MKTKKLMKMATFLVTYSHLPEEVVNPVFKKKFNISRKEFREKFQKWKRKVDELTKKTPNI